MSTLGDRIKKARLARGLTQAALGRHFEISDKAVSMWERDKNHVEPERIPHLASYLRVSTDWLLTGREPKPESASGPPIVGYVGAGGQIIPFDDHAMGAGMETAEPPPGDTSVSVAVIVRGHSMHPVYRDGDTIYYSRDGANDWRALIGKDCVARLADGRILVKVLKQSAQRTKWTLSSYNSPDIEDVDVEWVAPIRWVKRS